MLPSMILKPPLFFRGMTFRLKSRGISALECILICCIFSPVLINAEEQMIPCNVHTEACIFSSAGRMITLEITPRPVKAMQELQFKLTIIGSQIHKLPFIDLGMPGMTMGPNRILLTPGAAGTYEGKGVIVRCPSGRKTWFAKVTLPEIWDIRFVFDVVY
ncbi:MAG: hypothetical protein AB1659_03765 [Thermodesulfobacteriota bacterium]